MTSSLRNRIIELLKSHAGSYIPQSYIHRALSASKSRVSEVLSELEKEGLITRFVIGKSKLVYIHPGISEKTGEAEQRVIKAGIVYSSEYLFLQGMVKRLSKRGYSFEIVVFRDGLEATKALAEGNIDIVFSPLVTQLYVYPMYRTYKMVLAGLRGGFRLLELDTPGPIYSSLVSTMDYSRHLAISKGLVETTSTIYYRDPSEVLKAHKRGGYVLTWHPIYIELEKKGAKRVYRPEDIGVDFCCVLGVSTSLGNKTLEQIVKSYFDSLHEYNRSPEKGLEYYSLVTGIEYSVLKTAINEYKLAEDLDFKTIHRILQSRIPPLPSIDMYRDAIVASNTRT